MGIDAKRRTKALRRLDKDHLWHPFTRMREWADSEPIIIERAIGSYLIDIEGNRYLDGVSSLWVTVHGHRRREIDRAVKNQLDRVAHSTLLGLSNVPSIELAGTLVDIVPGKVTRVFYSDNGSTAVEAALKLAFYFWQAKGNGAKKKFLSFTGAYHGDTIGSMSVGVLDAFVGRFKPLLFRSLRAPYPYCYRCPIKKDFPSCKLGCLGELEKTLKKHHKTIAACIIEPMVQGAAGMITSPPGFLKGVRRLTKKYDVLLIADEVATGFGRTGTLFACEHEKVSPDLLCLAKGLTGGYMPLGATLATEKIFKAFLGTAKDPDAFYHGHTYTGNPLGCAAALASLDIFKKDRTIKGLAPKIRLLTKLLTPLRDLNHVGDIRQQGFMVGIELVKDKKTKRRFPAKERRGHYVCMGARDRGVIIRPLGDTIVLMPPLSIKDAELKRLVRTVRDSIIEVTGDALGKKDYLNS